MPDTRPAILLCWGYERKGWIEPFEKLSHAFNFIYLFHISPPENEIRHTANKVIYWGNYATPFEILKEIRPVKVVFMGISISYTIALNMACKKLNIPTYILQHGIAQDYAVYHLAEKLSRKNLAEAAYKENIKPEKLTNKQGALKFLLSAFTGSDWFYLPVIATYIYFLRKKGRFTAAKMVYFPQRIPDFYICYTRKNATLHFQTDRADERKMVYIGNPEFDNFFTDKASSSPGFGKYFLLIDQPIALNQHYSFGITREDVNEMYLKLTDFCRSQGAKLVVKLHPDSYKDTWQVKNENIIYLSEYEDLAGLIKNSMGCFGAFSTLLIPAVYFKPVIIFRFFGSSTQQHLLGLGVVAELDFFNFRPEDIDFNRVKILGSQCPEFVKSYFLKEDGKALERLSGVLKS